MAKCSGGLRTFLCFGYFLKMEAFRGELFTGHKNSSYNSLKFCINPIDTIVACMRRAIALPFGTMGACLRQKQRLYILRLPNSFVLRPLVLRVVSFERGYSALSDDVWYCSGWYWKFLRNIDLKSRHAKCVRVARCGSSAMCASMEVACCGSSVTCASMELKSFPSV